MLALVPLTVNHSSSVFRSSSSSSCSYDVGTLAVYCSVYNCYRNMQMCRHHSVMCTFVVQIVQVCVLLSLLAGEEQRCYQAHHCPLLLHLY
jgi:hypothetical protein